MSRSGCADRTIGVPDPSALAQLRDRFSAIRQGQVPDVAQANVITLHPFDDDEALLWLAERLEDRLEVNVSEISRQFGWTPTKLRRRLTTWAKAGHFTQESGGKGRVILASLVERPETP